MGALCTEGNSKLTVVNRGPQSNGLQSMDWDFHLENVGGEACSVEVGATLSLAGSSSEPVGQPAVVTQAVTIAPGAKAGGRLSIPRQGQVACTPQPAGTLILAQRGQAGPRASDPGLAFCAGQPDNGGMHVSGPFPCTGDACRSTYSLAPAATPTR